MVPKLTTCIILLPMFFIAEGIRSPPHFGQMIPIVVLFISTLSKFSNAMMRE